jgi:predicted RNA-binding Zn-ribbon protein involved in translation (DUF1610 family)
MELDEINRNGSLPCPGCGVHISPDDQTEEVYTLLDVNMNGVSLEEIVVRCNRCRSQIYIAGFSKAEQLQSTTKERKRSVA